MQTNSGLYPPNGSLLIADKHVRARELSGEHRLTFPESGQPSNTVLLGQRQSEGQPRIVARLGRAGSPRRRPLS